METGRVDWHRSGLVTGQVGSTLGDRCVTGQWHKMQKETFFKYKPKSLTGPISLCLDSFLWPPYVIGQAIIFLLCGFYLPSSFFLSFFPP